MSRESEIHDLNAVDYLYLEKLSEPRDNSLEIVVQQAILNRPQPLDLSADGRPDVARTQTECSPIESVASCTTFKLYWVRYAAYLVTEELVGSNARGGYEDEVFGGKLLRLYSKSHFLDHLTKDTGGHIEPIFHYKLICLNHLIDIAAYSAPEIQIVS